MPDYSKNIVYLSKEQYQTLITNQSVTANGQTITYNENDIYVTPQAEPITDVQVNGTSVANSGVANVPIANSSAPGVVKIDADYGIGIFTDNNIVYKNKLRINCAPSNMIKTGGSDFRPITPRYQHESVFFGLAKVAGTDLKDVANIVVGTYPDNAKAAIQSMLGVSDLLAPTESSLVASKAYAVGDVFTANGKLYKATAAIVSGESIVVQDKGETVSEHKAEEVTIGEYAVHDVQVNGASVLNNGVANVPIASDSSLGVVQIPIGSGLYLWPGGILSVAPAASAGIKSGKDGYSVLVPKRQHESTFYGLAKAAGVDLANETVTVGTYPAAAKTAIRTMLGATSSNVIEVSDTQPTDTDNKIWMPETAPAGIEVPTYAEFQAGLAGKVSDVKIGTSSIVTNNIATIPTASSSTAGVIKVISSYGFQINNAGCIASVPATEGDIRNGSSNFRFIVPSNQSQAIFFGLASAAGDATQAISNNAVGTYTADAAAAIRSMLGTAASADLALKADKTDTVLETTLSRGRKEETTIGTASFAFGYNVEASGNYSFAIGASTVAEGSYSYAEGLSSQALGPEAHAEGNGTLSVSGCAHSEGQLTAALGMASHVEGGGSGGSITLTGAENATTYTVNNISLVHIQDFIRYNNNWAYVTSIDTNNSTITLSKTLNEALDQQNCSIYYAYALGNFSHAEGLGTITIAKAQHAQGMFNNNITPHEVNWAANTTYTIGDYVVKSHDYYKCIEANSDATWDVNKWKKVCSLGFADIVGNGFYNDRSNAYALDWEGNAYYAGNIYVGCNNDSTGGTRLPHDIQINGTSIVTNGVAQIPLATESQFGITQIGRGLMLNSNDNTIQLSTASAADLKGSGTYWWRAITQAVVKDAAFYGLAKASGDTTQSASSNAVGTYTDSAKASIKSMLGIVDGSTGTVTVTGTTPTITAVENTRYVCGEVSTLSITPPACGICIVRFTSGTTAVVVTVPNTVKFPEWFDVTALDANTIYEMCITDGIYGAVMSWAL